MKCSNVIILLIVLVSACSIGQNPIGKIKVVMDQNSNAIQTIKIQLDELTFLKENEPVLVKVGKDLIPWQYIDSDGDGNKDHLLLNLSKQKEAELNIRFYTKPDLTEYNQEKNTQAELWYKVTGKFKEGRYLGGGNFYRFDSLRVPDDFMDHAYYIKYEGPGWESDKVGYRLYLDWRNAIDVYGKRTNDMVLQNVGADGYESYHHLQDWGMDILKVGNSLGIGTTAWWDGQKAVRVEKTDSVICRILADGDLQSQVQIWYYGWQIGEDKVNMMSLKSINSGSRLTHERLEFNQPTGDICTGIRKDKKAKLIQLQGEQGEWGCIATWGDQSLNNDSVGLAILYPLRQNPVFDEDDLNYVIRFKKASTLQEYYFLAAWELEENGIKNEEMFTEYLLSELNNLENPVQFSLN